MAVRHRDCCITACKSTDTHLSAIYCLGRSELTQDSKLPQSQNQLHEAARAIQALAFGATCLPQAQAYNAKAVELLKVFFLDPQTRMVPEVNYSQCIPGQGGDKAFAISLRYIILVDQALSVLQMPPDVQEGMRAWLQAQGNWMSQSQQGADARASGNNITLWYHAIVSL